MTDFQIDFDKGVVIDPEGFLSVEHPDSKGIKFKINNLNPIAKDGNIAYEYELEIKTKSSFNEEKFLNVIKILIE